MVQEMPGMLNYIGGDATAYFPHAFVVLDEAASFVRGGVDTLEEVVEIAILITINQNPCLAINGHHISHQGYINVPFFFPTSVAISTNAVAVFSQYLV